MLNALSWVVTEDSSHYISVSKFQISTDDKGYKQSSRLVLVIMEGQEHSVLTFDEF